MVAPLQRSLSLVAVVIAASAFVATATSRAAVLPTLYVNYTNACSFTILDDSSKKVTSIAPGTYQIAVTTPETFSAFMPDPSNTNDYTACKGMAQFQLTGPGVNVQTTLQDGDEDHDNLKATFQASATYVALDNNLPSQTRTTFTTLASGSPTAPAGTASTASGKGETQGQLAGSAAAAQTLRGSLDAIVYKSGKLTLSRNGKKVTSLKEGKWTFSVDDESKISGFDVQVLGGKVQVVTGGSYVGSHNVTLTLKPGRWFFFSPSGGLKTTFFVVS